MTLDRRSFIALVGAAPALIALAGQVNETLDEKRVALEPPPGEHPIPITHVQGSYPTMTTLTMIW